MWTGREVFITAQDVLPQPRAEESTEVTSSVSLRDINTCRDGQSSTFTCILIYIYIYMLGTDVKPQARFKAVRTVLKPSGPL